MVQALEKIKEKAPLTIAGLMSGTSMDGLDICVADIDFHGESVRFVIRGCETVAFPPNLSEAIRRSLSGSTEQVCRTHYELGRFYAEQTDRFLAGSEIHAMDVIGMHGQTVHHISGESTLQIGEPSFLAERLKVPVISDFRSRDISVGGTGAPLIPVVDKWIFQREYDGVVCLNLGGIANISFIPPRISSVPVLGFDTGPGMALLDEAVRRTQGKNYDENGSLASSGMPDENLVKRWLEDEFVSQSPPKSTGRDHYGALWLEKNVESLNEWRIEDLLASLSLFTARSVGVNCRRFVDFDRIRTIIVSGGGVHHTAVMEMLIQEFSPVEVRSSATFSVNPDMKEALGIAILTAAYFRGIPGNIPSVTGASHSVVLGKLTI